MRGNEWWGLHDDGTWVRWNNQTLEWDAQPDAPPQEELQEVTRKPHADLADDAAAGPSTPTSAAGAEGVDPLTGLPLPLGPTVKHWELQKTFGTPPQDMPSGAKSFRWGFRRNFGPFPLGNDPVDPKVAVDAASRSAYRKAWGKVQRMELRLAVVLGVLFIGGILFLLWLIGKAIHVG